MARRSGLDLNTNLRGAAALKWSNVQGWTDLESQTDEP